MVCSDGLEKNDCNYMFLSSFDLFYSFSFCINYTLVPNVGIKLMSHSFISNQSADAVFFEPACLTG